MPKKSYAIIASVLAAALAVGTVAIVRAHTSDHSSAGATLAGAGESNAAINPATPSADGGLSSLLPVTPDGNGASYGTYAASATMAASASSWISKYYPKQTAAKQTSDPATHFWALLIGINDYSGSTESNVGSKQDAQSLNTYLTKLGWRSDHIILLTDLPATASHIVDAIRWLASKTDGSSTVVFHYSGHENWRPSSSEDLKKEIAIWASDNRMIYEKTLAQELGRVRASKMWLDFATCRAAGFDEPGMVKTGRVLTYSSTKAEFSYEDPKLHHSVFGWFEINNAMYARKGDANHDGKVTVEEAFAYSKDRVINYTSGNQHPVMVDKAGGRMSLTIPKPAPKPAPSSSSPKPAPTSTPPKTCVVICV